MYSGQSRKCRTLPILASKHYAMTMQIQPSKSRIQILEYNCWNVTFSFMFSRAFRWRYYSTPREALKLWVKHNGGPSTQVPVNGCIMLMALQRMWRKNSIPPFKSLYLRLLARKHLTLVLKSVNCSELISSRTLAKHLYTSRSFLQLKTKSPLKLFMFKTLMKNVDHLTDLLRF